MSAPVRGSNAESGILCCIRSGIGLILFLIIFINEINFKIKKYKEFNFIYFFYSYTDITNFYSLLVVQFFMVLFKPNFWSFK